MDKEKAEKLDVILEGLSKNGELKGFDSSIDPEDLRLLESYGYVKLIEGSGEIKAYSLNGKGVVFLEEGGFSKVVADETRCEKDRKLDRFQKWISILKDNWFIIGITIAILQLVYLWLLQAYHI